MDDTWKRWHIIIMLTNSMNISNISQETVTYNGRKYGRNM